MGGSRGGTGGTAWAGVLPTATPPVPAPGAAGETFALEWEGKLCGTRNLLINPGLQGGRLATSCSSAGPRAEGCDGLGDSTTTPVPAAPCAPTPAGLGWVNILGGDQLGAAGNIAVTQVSPLAAAATGLMLLPGCLPRQCTSACHPSHGDPTQGLPGGQRRLSGPWPCLGGLGDV